MMRNALRGRTRYPGQVDSFSRIPAIVAQDSCVCWVDVSVLTGYANDDTVASFTPNKGGDWTAAGGNPLYKTNIVNGLPTIYLGNNIYFTFDSIVVGTIMGVFLLESGDWRFILGTGSTQWHGGQSTWASSYSSITYQRAAVYKSGVFQNVATSLAKTYQMGQWSIVASSQPATSFAVGNLSNRNFKGYLAELFLFEYPIIDTDDFAYVTNYLCAKYNLWV